MFTPSPDKYKPKDLSIKSPAWKISQKKRLLTHVDSKTPGSGKYEYKSFIGEGPKYSFSSSIPEIEKNKKKILKTSKTMIFPGPGSYNIKSDIGGVQYSMGYRRVIKDKSHNYQPPVGTYNLRNDDDLNLCCNTFGKEKRINLELNRSALKNPGPGHYYFSEESTGSSGPKWSFAALKLDDDKKDDNKINEIKKKMKEYRAPGPGQYNIPDIIGNEVKSYTFSKVKYNHSDTSDEMMSKINKNNPGPTTYNISYCNINKYISDGPVWSIPRLERKDLTKEKSKIPGPGKYNPKFLQKSNYKKLPCWSFFQSSKYEKLRFSTPSPVKYNVKNGMFPQGIKYSIGNSVKKEKFNDFPGPGAYNIKYDGKSSGPKYSFGKEEIEENSKKNSDDKKNKDISPGPGSYNIKDSPMCKGISISPIITEKDIRKKKQLEAPGPGQYKIPSSFNYINDYTREKGAFDPSYRYI